jgi:hypothetical protein
MVERQNSSTWKCFTTDIPRSEVIYIGQILAVYIVIIASIINLGLSNENSNLWSALLSSSLGYLLPSPSLNKHETERTTRRNNYDIGRPGSFESLTRLWVFRWTFCVTKWIELNTFQIFKFFKSPNLYKEEKNICMSFVSET